MPKTPRSENARVAIASGAMAAFVAGRRLGLRWVIRTAQRERAEAAILGVDAGTLYPAGWVVTLHHAMRRRITPGREKCLCGLLAAGFGLCSSWLRLALIKLNIVAAIRLIEHGAPIDVGCMFQGREALSLGVDGLRWVSSSAPAEREAYRVRLAELLFRDGGVDVPLGAFRHKGATLLQHSVTAGDAVLVTCLLRLGANPNLKREQQTALDDALESHAARKADIPEILIAAGGKRSICGVRRDVLREGGTPAQAAARAEAVAAI